MPNSMPIYDPSVFDRDNIEEARAIVLTAESGIDTQTRWATETPWLFSLFGKHIKPDGLVIDYGCGVGRIASGLIDSGYPVIGIDTSADMRRHATNLIANDRFVAMTPTMLDQLIGIGVKAETVLAVWVLQHCLDLNSEVDRIYRSLNKGGIVGVVDMRHRAVPTNQGWLNDGNSPREALAKRFNLIQQYAYSPPSAPKDLRENAYVAFFQKIR
jgi:SAM-dependent methyltransferase